MEKISFREANNQRNFDAFNQKKSNSICYTCAHRHDCMCGDYIRTKNHRDDEVITECAYYADKLTEDYYKADMLGAFNDYCANEFDNEPIEAWPEDGIIGLAYTSYEFEEEYNFEHEIQVNFDINEMKYKCYIDDVLVHEEDWTAESFVENMNASFEDLIRDAVHIGFDMGDEGLLEDDVLTEEIFEKFKKLRTKAC